VSGVAERFADVNGVRLHYRVAGSGSRVVLLHGYTQTGHIWHPIVPSLAQRHTVIVPDLRGAVDRRSRTPVTTRRRSKASGDFLIAQARQVATNVRGEVIKGSGHWLMEETPSVVMPAVISFVN
jgi:pimeloyl-ACP methyl ester carboxylesterase